MIQEDGLDRDAEGYGTVTANRLYQLVRQHDNLCDHTFTIDFLAPGVESYSLTFG